MKIVREMIDHGKLCGRKIYFRRNDVTTKRFTMTFKCTCSLEKRCHKWENGIFKWQSCNVIRIWNDKSFPIPDVLYALSICMTPNTMAHADQLLSAMMLNPPSRNLLKDIMKKVVDPYLAKQKHNMISQACDDLRSMSNSTILCMDVGHSSARNSQAATLAAACGNILLFTLTDTHMNAWLKQSSLVARAKFVIRYSFHECDFGYQEDNKLTCRRYLAWMIWQVWFERSVGVIWLGLVVMMLEKWYRRHRKIWSEIWGSETFEGKKYLSISSWVSFGMANKIDRVAAGNSISLRKWREYVSVSSSN